MTTGKVQWSCGFSRVIAGLRATFHVDEDSIATWVLKVCNILG